MGFEYRIRFRPSDQLAWDAFIQRLDNPPSESGWPAFVVELSEDGVYFCDNGRSDAAAVALRRIIDEALKQNASVAIEEL